MPFDHWKEPVLSAYYLATLPARRRAAARRAAAYREPVSILFYHRVADQYPNSWTISTQLFARQITWLRARFELVSLAEAQARIRSGRNDRPTACITFDDGYADNMLFAIPLLLKHHIPFTYFVSTRHVLGGTPFPHDVVAGRPLAPNTPADLRYLSASGVEIGGHTRRHVDLGRLNGQQLWHEIAGCKLDLENTICQRIRYFAFPFGLHQNMSGEAFHVALEAGFEGVCSAYGGYNLPGDDSFHLRRIHADPSMVRFKNWLTIDPRKVRIQRDFDPGNFRCNDQRSCHLTNALR